MGSSLLEKDQIETVKGYLAQAEESGVDPRADLMTQAAAG